MKSWSSYTVGAFNGIYIGVCIGFGIAYRWPPNVNQIRYHFIIFPVVMLVSMLPGAMIGIVEGIKRYRSVARRGAFEPGKSEPM